MTSSRPGLPGVGGRVVLVLGMSRTGTSTTTRMLRAMGLELGTDDVLLGPIEHANLKGFYEHYAIMRLNTALLRRLGGSWREVPPLEPGWEQDPGLDDLRETAVTLVTETFAGARVWGFKDPRTCLTLPFWRDLIGDVDFVVCHRNPLAVADSLKRRDGIEAPEAMDLWRRYSAAAITQTTGARRIVVGYDEWFDQRRVVLADLAAFMGVSAGRLAELEACANQWIEADLRHHSHELQALFTHPVIEARDASFHLLCELASRMREREPALAGAGGTGAVSSALVTAALALLPTR